MFARSILRSRWGLTKSEALEPDGGKHVVDKSHRISLVTRSPDRSNVQTQQHNLLVLFLRGRSFFSPASRLPPIPLTPSPPQSPFHIPSYSVTPPLPSFLSSFLLTPPCSPAPHLLPHSSFSLTLSSPMRLLLSSSQPSISVNPRNPTATVSSLFSSKR
ncbi:hypothetical protein PoB_000381900 [Plakobranchus ocellatus]|uniref:Uncharacterized protein n=1 Tax=Plakobranchus ocellatus TaxID=259542 RepID=A0AAV3Y522_9GAST|nr:hypothetical protein PoB_000381900 [Plakobranchus ocellatus]